MNFTDIIDLFLHLDVHLNALAASQGHWIYAILFLIVFCETGLVITPFLPGDSLLFAVGALAATENSVLSIYVIIPLLFFAALLGDLVNFTLGYHFGERVSRHPNSLVRREQIAATEKYYAKYGGRTIVMARFIPIVRTFAPFVAGTGKMAFLYFAGYSVFGAILWVFGLTLVGYFFGGIPLVKSNFSIVVIAIIGISILPMVFEVIRARRSSRSS